MDKELLNNISSRLYEMTLSDEVSWKLSQKSKNSYKFACEIDKTTFKMEIYVDEDSGSIANHDMWWLYIYNENLNDGYSSMFSNNHPYVSKIANLLHSKYVKQNLNNKSQEVILNGILNSLGKDQIRDTKIENILKG